MNFEENYIKIVEKILKKGILKSTRNSNTLSIFGEVLEINTLEHGFFPLITTRKIFYKGAIGEYAAFLRGPKTVQDFEKFGCNYWKLWSKENGDINVDYGNKWLDFGGVNQLGLLIKTLKENPNDRRMIISGWDPGNIQNLDLPCCHYSYQFYVRNGKLDLLWNQRSADFMVGVPSDIILASLMVITIAAETGLKPGTIKMVFGDTHIYEDHIESAKEQINRETLCPSLYTYKHNGIYNFIPEDIELYNYHFHDPIKYKLIG